MRGAIVVAVLVSACNSDPPDITAPATDVQPVTKEPNLPRVDDANIVLAPALAPQPAAFVWVGPSGKLELGVVGASWDGTPPTARHRVLMPSSIRTEVLQAALTSNDAVRGAAQAQLLGKDTPAPAIDTPQQPTAEIVPATQLDPVVPVVSLNPTTPALQVARVLVRTGGLIAVNYDHAAKVLMFGAQLGVVHAAQQWIEVQVNDSGVRVTQFPDDVGDDIPWLNGHLQRTALAAALTKARDRRLGDQSVDVLVGPDVNSQLFIDVLVAVHGSGAEHVFVGERATNDSSGIVQHSPARTQAIVRLGQPASQGDLDKAIIRRYMRRNTQQFQYCYERRLLANATLAGTVDTQFFISPDGTVASANASGVDAELASCIADVVKGIEFPKPKGGGGVQVNYPLTFERAP